MLRLLVDHHEQATRADTHTQACRQLPPRIEVAEWRVVLVALHARPL